jgi:hypothetical protein
MMLLALVLAMQTAQAPVRVGGNIPPPQKIKDVRPPSRSPSASP